MNIKDAQTILKSLGYYTGELDGIWGRYSINALRKFQRHFGLLPDGILGPKTRSKLFSYSKSAKVRESGKNSLDFLPWFEEAKRLMGTREIRGRRSNSVIMNWARKLRIGYRNDDVPWCGLFAAHCISATLPEEKIPVNPLWARNWLKFGDRTTPRLGAIMVFSRGKGGHVGFYAGEVGSYYVILGGNQSNSVTEMKIAKTRLLGARWPSTAKSLTSNTILVDKGNFKTSRNEA